MNNSFNKDALYIYSWSTIIHHWTLTLIISKIIRQGTRKNFSWSSAISCILFFLHTSLIAAQWSNLTVLYPTLRPPEGSCISKSIAGNLIFFFFHELPLRENTTIMDTDLNAAGVFLVKICLESSAQCDYTEFNDFVKNRMIYFFILLLSI